MGKVITVWGSPGSGKSMFSCILAKALTRDKRKAIIINAEISVPMLPVWLPEQIDVYKRQVEIPVSSAV